jgi:uroporphyrinogen-III synthase
VLVTRAAGQASALAEGLRAAGMEPVVVPVIEIVEPESWAAADAALGRLGSFDWVVFTSPNAVERFVGRWVKVVAGTGEKQVLPLRQVQGQDDNGKNHVDATRSFATEFGGRVAAIGQGTARACELVGMKVDLVPAKAVAESLAEALVPMAQGKRFLLPRAAAARDVLPEALRAAGGEVEDVAVYRNAVPEGSVAAVRELFAEGARGVDAVTFTSASTVVNLLALLEVSGVRLPADVARVSMGPITSEALRAHGLQPDAEADEATITSLVEKVDEVVLHTK